jgi:hypothetical protein
MCLYSRCADVLILKMRWCAYTKDALMCLYSRCADVLILKDALMCLYSRCADALILKIRWGYIAVYASRASERKLINSLHPKGLQGVTRMAYSPRLWLMAVGWWNKIDQCRKLKLNLTQTWGVCMSLDSGMHWSQNQWYCDDKPRKKELQSSMEQTHVCIQSIYNKLLKSL